MTVNCAVREPAKMFPIEPVDVVAGVACTFLEIRDGITTPRIDGHFIVQGNIRLSLATSIEERNIVLCVTDDTVCRDYDRKNPADQTLGGLTILHYFPRICHFGSPVWCALDDHSNPKVRQTRPVRPYPSTPRAQVP